MTSATGGYLAPTGTIVHDDALDDIFQAMVVGITAIPGRNVMPRFQEEPPTLPKRGTDWCAIGVIDLDDDVLGAQVHDPAGDGSTTLQTHETLTVLASFYGPNAQALSKRLIRGLLISQNRETIAAEGIEYKRTLRSTKVPQMFQATWTNRIDVMMEFRRQLNTSYAILNILSASGQIKTESVSTNFETPPDGG